MGLIFQIHALPAVGDGQGEKERRLSCRDGDRTLGRCVLRRVFEDVQQGFFAPARIGLYLTVAGIDVHLQRFFAQEQIVITRKTKRGEGESDIAPAIREIAFSAAPGRVDVAAVISAQEPTLNPDHLAAALRQKAPELAPDFAEFTRLEVYDENMRVFR